MGFDPSEEMVRERNAAPPVGDRNTRVLSTTSVAGARMALEQLGTSQLSLAALGAEVSDDIRGGNAVHVVQFFTGTNIFFGFWEPAITAYVSSQLKPCDTFIDIGANIGYYSLLASRCVGPSGRVFAFEAAPSISALLQNNLASNAAHNVMARNVAITDQRSEVPIFVNEARLGESTIVAGVADQIGAQMEALIPGYPLGDLINADIIHSARFIKIDVEGAEWLVVKGIRNFIPRLAKYTELLIEINSESTRDLGGSSEELLTIFQQAGFSVFEINNSYGVEAYIRRDPPRLTKYDGKPFVQKDFVLKRDWL